jgi:hypothetical protein
MKSIDPDLKLIYNSHKVPYFIQQAIAADGYISIPDLADRWSTLAEARTQAPADYAFDNGNNHHDVKTSLRSAIRLCQAIESAQEQKKRRITAASSADKPDGTATILPGQRAQLEARYCASTNLPKPSMDLQGSDHYMGLQYKACTKGEIGYFTNKQIVSYLPEQGEIQQRKKRRTDNDGVTREFEEEERHDPTTIEQWKRQMTVFKNTLLMCTWAFPQFSQFNVTKTDMDEFYDFIYGSEIATRTPAPSLAVLMIAERKAWREVVLQMHKGTNLKEAIQNMRNNHLFWNREVYERIHHNNHYNNNNQAASGAANQAPYTPTRRGLRGGSSQHSQQWSPDKPTRQWNATPLNYDNHNTYSPKGKGKTQNKHWVPPPPAPYHKGNKGKDGGKKRG